MVTNSTSLRLGKKRSSFGLKQMKMGMHSLFQMPLLMSKILQTWLPLMCVLVPVLVFLDQIVVDVCVVIILNMSSTG